MSVSDARLAQLAARFAELEARLASGTLEGPEFVVASRDYAELEPVAKVAAEVAAEQIEDLVRRGIDEFHLYTMNRAPLVSAVLDNLGFSRRPAKSAGAAA